MDHWYFESGMLFWLYCSWTHHGENWTEEDAFVLYQFMLSFGLFSHFPG